MMYSCKSLRPGMELQDPVRDTKGQVLLPAGVVLGDSHIAQLLQRGIAAVSVAVNETEEERELRIGKEKERVLELFGETGETAELEQLRRLILERVDVG
jgi:hypothetical protein